MAINVSFEGCFVHFAMLRRRQWPLQLSDKQPALLRNNQTTSSAFRNAIASTYIDVSRFADIFLSCFSLRSISGVFCFPSMQSSPPPSEKCI